MILALHKLIKFSMNITVSDRKGIPHGMDTISWFGR